MDYPSRDEMEARIATVEARVSGRAATFQATVDGYIALMNEREIEDRQRFDRIEAMVADIQAQIRSLKTTIIVTAISTGIAVGLGIGAMNATMTATILAAFETGSGVAAAQAEMKRNADRLIAAAEALEKQRAQQEQEEK
ncbi:hypothetical protein [Pseudoduganella rhizocola]|uniref:hypothetical protein n=1 Tax=Pseudoduganella rhizocola TaxID=3382643 RepID=UPI0038B53F61